MHDSFRPISGDDGRDRFLIPDIDFVNGDPGANRFEIPFLDKRIVKIVKIVNNRDAGAWRQQSLNEV